MKTILLVDDEPSIAQIAGHYLRHGGFSVITASNGVDALALARGGSAFSLHACCGHEGRHKANATARGGGLPGSHAGDHCLRQHDTVVAVSSGDVPVASRSIHAVAGKRQ